MLLADIFKVLSDENRLRIFSILINENLCVCEIEMALNMTQSNVSRHLSKLKSFDLITGVKEAQWVYYKICDNFINTYPLLYEFLIEQSNQNSILINDKKLIGKYKNSNCNFKEFKWK